MIRSYFWLPIIAAFFSLSCNNSQPQIPKLVITLVVDQMRPDLLTRFDDLYTGGFRWLMDHGIWFTDAHHEHSYTATGPGHFAIGSGQYPGRVGVIGNSFYDRDLQKKVNCVEDPDAHVVGAEEGKARSYSRYNTTGLGDWVKSSFSNSKVISIGGKDRTAVLLGGQKPDLALYFNYAGRFISSDYYVESLPDWANQFNTSLNAEAYKDSLWTKSLPDDVYLKYAREDFYQGELDDYLNDDYSPVFPIGIDPKNNPKEYFMARPWFEREILNLAKEAVVNENLGVDSSPDLLFIGFSAMDWMIHDYGPFSQEIMDAFIKLDKYLGNFIEFLDKSVGLNNVQFVLTGDHGGLPLPEYVIEQGGIAGRINREHLKEAFEWIDEEVEEKIDGCKNSLAVITGEENLESEILSSLSQNESVFLEIDDAFNLSLLSTARAREISQHQRTYPEPDSAKHYICFISTGGHDFGHLISGLISNNLHYASSKADCIGLPS